jgi:hypothetical protein
VAQQAARWTVNPEVVGSSPTEAVDKIEKRCYTVFTRKERGLNRRRKPLNGNHLSVIGDASELLSCIIRWAAKVALFFHWGLLKRSRGESDKLV